MNLVKCIVLLSLPPFEAVYGGLLSVWDLGTIQEFSVRAVCSTDSSSVSFWGGDGALSDSGVPQVTAVVAADGPGQAWVMLWGSQIISTWSRNEPRLQLDSYGLDSWQESLPSSKCKVAPPSGRRLFCSLYFKIGLFPQRDVITVKAQ